MASPDLAQTLLDGFFALAGHGIAGYFALQVARVATGTPTKPKKRRVGGGQRRMVGSGNEKDREAR